MATRDHLMTAEQDLIKIAERAGLPVPDEINYHDEDDEVELIWREQKLAVIVECGPGRPVDHDEPAEFDEPADADAYRDIPF
jgi:hypothetical protein